MRIDKLPGDVQIHLDGALQDLSITKEDLGFWEVSDHGLFVLTTESFYQTLNYRKADPLEFLHRRVAGQLPHRGSYRDSRTYLSVILDHYRQEHIAPAIIDIGGYIGRFSLESALLVKDFPTWSRSSAWSRG